MKKNIFYLMTIALVAIIAFTNCKKDEPAAKQVAEINLNKTTLLLAIGDIETLVATVLPADAVNRGITWTSAAASVATVDANGKVTAVSLGTASITAAAGDIKTICAVTVTTIPMVEVAGGTFTMGDTLGSSDEKPTHSVTLNTFYMGKYEVTQKQWRDVMGVNPSYFTGDSLPVEQVSWDEVQTFIEKLKEKTGETYRLPTEAEWEYAARGGKQSQGYKYSGSNTVGDVAWFYGNSSNKTHAVGTKTPNELGIYDMSGNVWEWCSDWYSAYTATAQIDPQGPSSGSSRVFRGGSWYFDARGVRSSIRGSGTPGLRIINVGFRLARSSSK